MSRRMFGVPALMLALALPMTACDDVATDTRHGTVSILLTDAPGDVVEAWVTFTDIYFQGQGGEGDPPMGRVYLLEGGDEAYELLSLANDVAEVVRDAVVPTGTYGQLRVVISDACIVTEAGAVYSSSGAYDLCGPRTGTLHMPSLKQSGLKVNLNGFQVTSGDHAVLLDFDVSQSFGRQAGNSGMWVMAPVIHGAAIQHAAAIQTTLSAGEVVLPETVALTDFSVTLTPAEGDVLNAAFQEVDEVFVARFPYLIAGNGPFELRVNAPEGFTVAVDPASPRTESVASAETVYVNWVITGFAEIED
jgi:hypothetical protein